MKKIFYLCVISCILVSADGCCNYVTFHRHINVDLDDNKTFNQSGQFAKTYFFDSKDLINAVTENINAKDARIENLQIESLQISISLTSANTASSIHNVHIKLAKGWGDDGASLAKLDTARIFINKPLVYLANNYLIFKGVEKVKQALTNNLATKKQEVFQLELTGLIPTGQVFSGNVTLILKASLDAVTCELVPFGLGPSECMIIPFTLRL